VKLTTEQRASLMQHYLGHDDGTVRRQCHMVMLWDDGFSVRRVATLTASGAEEVHECIAKFRAGGMDALLDVG
jgi:hypothetical protein